MPVPVISRPIPASATREPWGFDGRFTESEESMTTTGEHRRPRSGVSASVASRGLRWLSRRITIHAIALACAAVPASAWAQVPDSAFRPPLQPVRSDSTLRPPISARRALVYSMLVPGSAQTILRRPRAAALFAGMEALSITMARKSAADLREAKRAAQDSIVAVYRIDPVTGLAVRDTAGNLVVEAFMPNPFGTERVAARRTHYEDWVAALIFNHLISGVEAFVAAQLWDLPAQVSVRAYPRGVVLAASVPW
jgi:hypothetical protein